LSGDDIKKLQEFHVILIHIKYSENLVIYLYRRKYQNSKGIQSQEYPLSQNKEYFYNSFEASEEMEIEEEVFLEKRNLRSSKRMRIELANDISALNP